MNKVAIDLTANEIVGKSQAINTLLTNREDKFNRRLIFILRTNSKFMADALETIKGDLPEDVEGWDKFNQDRFDKAIELGGKVKSLSNGAQHVDFNHLEDKDRKKLEKALEKLHEDNKELIEKQEKISEEVNKILSETKVPVELMKLPLDAFPEEISADQIPIEIIDLIDYS